MVFRIILGMLLIVVTMVFMVTKDFVLPIIRFQTRAESIFTMWDMFLKDLLVDEFELEETAFCKCGKFVVIYSNHKAASIFFESCINETLEYYNLLGEIVYLFPSIQEDKDRLCRIAIEVRRMRLNYKD